jgi:hypothetical protein
MLVPLKEWKFVQGAVLLLSTLLAMLGKLVEWVLPTGPVSGAGRPALLPVRSVHVPTRGVVRSYRVERDFTGRGQARSVNPATRSSSRVRFSE